MRHAHQTAAAPDFELSPSAELAECPAVAGPGVRAELSGKAVPPSCSRGPGENEQGSQRGWLWHPPTQVLFCFFLLFLGSQFHPFILSAIKELRLRTRAAKEAAPLRQD